MASNFIPVSRQITKGFDQQRQRHLMDSAACWTLNNLKPVKGRLEQTPWVDTFKSMTNLTGDTTSPTRFVKLVKDIAGNLQYLILNEANARFMDPVTTTTQVLIPSVQQVACPADTTLTGQCLLYGISVLDFTTTNDQFDVKTVSASTFEWRKNGGAWSSALTIGPATLITSNGLTVAFQAGGAVTDYVNYPVGSVWSWQRKDAMPTPLSDATTFNLPYGSDSYQNDTYIGGYARTVWRVRDNMITTVGYTRAYGKHVAIFENHLFISHFAPGVYNVSTGIADSYNPQTTPFIMGWSHLDNPDQTFPTNINEADQKVLPQQSSAELSNLGIMGMAPWRGLLYAFLTDNIWTCQYVGLPNVMYWTTLNSNVGSLFGAGIVRTPLGLYFIGRNDFYNITYFEPTAIGQRVRDQFLAELVSISNPRHQRTFGFYNTQTKEVIWTYWKRADANGRYQERQVVFCELTQEWYFRNMPCADSQQSDCLCGTQLYDSQTQNIYGYKQVLNADQAPGVTTGGLGDVIGVSSGVFVNPQFETGFLNYQGNDPFHVKEASTMQIDAGADVGMQVVVGQFASDLIGKPANPMTYTTLSQTWVPGLKDTRLSLPRTSYRQVAYQFVMKVASGILYGGVFNLYQEFIRGPDKGIEK